MERASVSTRIAGWSTRCLAVDLKYPQRIIVNRCQNELSATRRTDQRHALRIAIKDEAAGNSRHRGEAVRFISFQKASIRGVISSCQRLFLIFISRKQEVHIPIVIQVIADNGIYRCELGLC